MTQLAEWWLPFILTIYLPTVNCSEMMKIKQKRGRERPVLKNDSCLCRKNSKMLLLRLKTYFTFFLPSPINQYFSFKECSIFCTSVRRASACHCRHCHFGFDWRTDGRSKCLATTSIQLLRLVSFKNWAPPPPHPIHPIQSFNSGIDTSISKRSDLFTSFGDLRHYSRFDVTFLAVRNRCTETALNNVRIFFIPK